MATKLQQYFPMIRSREELLAEIMVRDDLRQMYVSWKEEQQQEFLDFCSGVRGVKLLYDSFFKKIMSPEFAPERLEELLSLLLGVKVKILAVLPNESSHLADESTLLIMDIVVELENHGIINVEVQKIGYKFPGERGACYSADLLLRQYKRIRSEKKKRFSYRDIRDVYTIVLFEKSPQVFHQFPGDYLHFFEQKSNTGIELNLLQKYLFIPLDIFGKILQYKGITSKTDAWLAFLSMDDPEVIVRLMTDYPEFKPLYKEVYQICRNVEGVMGLFSEELRELDRNTVQLMIDEMQETIDRQKAELEEANRQKEEANRQKEEANRREEDNRRRIAELEELLKQQTDHQ